MAKPTAQKRKEAKPPPKKPAKSQPAGKKRRGTMADGADRYALYRLSVQDPPHEVRMFQRFYKDAFGREATTLREDFCAAFAVCCEWVRGRPERTAVGVDLDPEPLAYGKAHYLSALSKDEAARVRLLQEDVLSCRVKAELIAAQNFSFFLFKERALLKSYFSAVHKSLEREGIFVMDMMGGGSMHDQEIEESRQVARPTMLDKQKNPPFRYVWEEERFNPITHDALFHIHFRFPDGSALDKAFSYDWRLWTLPEVRELLTEAGFSAVHIYWETDDQDGSPSGHYRRTSVGTPDLAWLCYVVAVR